VANIINKTQVAVHFRPNDVLDQCHMLIWCDSSWCVHDSSWSNLWHLNGCVLQLRRLRSKWHWHYQLNCLYLLAYLNNFSFIFELREVHFISFKVHKVQAKKKFIKFEIHGYVADICI